MQSSQATMSRAGSRCGLRVKKATSPTHRGDPLYPANRTSGKPRRVSSGPEPGFVAAKIDKGSGVKPKSSGSPGSSVDTAKLMFGGNGHARVEQVGHTNLHYY